MMMVQTSPSLTMPRFSGGTTATPPTTSESTFDNVCGVTPQFFPDRYSTDAEALEELVQCPIYQGNILDTPGPQGSTALIMLATQGRTREAEELINRGASVDLEMLEFDDGKNMSEKRKRTAFLAACAAGHSDTVTALLNLKAQITLGKSDTGATGVLLAAQHGHIDVLEVLAERGADLNCSTSDDGTPPVWMAAQEGHIGVVRVLGEKGADMNKVKADTGTPPIWMAAQEGHHEIVKVLVEYGADVNQSRRVDGARALHVAAQHGHMEMIKFLTEEQKCVVDVPKTDTGATPLYLAAQHGNVEASWLLLRNGGDVNRGRRDGLTPLHVAAYLGHLDVVVLLACMGAHLNAKDNAGRRPQDFHDQTVNNFLNAVNGLSPIEIAARANHIPVAKFLLRQGLATPETLSFNRLPQLAIEPVRTVAEPVARDCINLMKLVSGSWNFKSHRYYPQHIQGQIQAILLVAQRLRAPRNETESALSAVNPPQEIWDSVILTFVTRLHGSKQLS